MVTNRDDRDKILLDFEIQKKTPNPCKKTRPKLWNIRVTPIVNGLLGMILKGAGRVGNRRTSRDYPNYTIDEIGLNTENSPADLRRLAVTQTPLMRKILKGVK